MIGPINNARELRKRMTPQESLLWMSLRNRTVCNHKFRRQHPIITEVTFGNKQYYIADFYCAACKLVIELDGKHHEFGEQKMYDDARDYIMKCMGLKIIRIKNQEIDQSFNSVLERISYELRVS